MMNNWDDLSKRWHEMKEIIYREKKNLLPSVRQSKKIIAEVTPIKDLWQSWALHTPGHVKMVSGGAACS